MAHDYDIDDIIREHDAYAFDVYCPECGDEASVEPDGWFECECGTRHESPLLEMGLI